MIYPVRQILDPPSTDRATHWYLYRLVRYVAMLLACLYFFPFRKTLWPTSIFSHPVGGRPTRDMGGGTGTLLSKSILGLHSYAQFLPPFVSPLQAQCAPQLTTPFLRHDNAVRVAPPLNPPVRVVRAREGFAGATPPLMLEARS